MDKKLRSELDSIRTELNTILNELYSIQEGIGKDFFGINSSHCREKIYQTREKYKSIKKKLDKI